MKQLFSRTSTLFVVALVAALAGCASGVTRLDAPVGSTATTASTSAPGKTVKSVSLWLNDDAKKLLADNLKFNADTLKSTVERALSAQSAMKPDATQQLDIEITSFRVRSNFSAVMFGFMAGNDNVEGVVTLKDGDGKVLKRGKVSASYALGGIGGGQDDARMGWLYEEFAKHAAAEVVGAPVAK
jgi:Domain of unknown function (DUF4410)